MTARSLLGTLWHVTRIDDVPDRSLAPPQSKGEPFAR
jgi:hypothetical protein